MHSLKEHWITNPYISLLLIAGSSLCGVVRSVAVLKGCPGQPPGASPLEEGRVRGEWERPGALVGGMEDAVLPWGLALGGPDDDQGAGGQPEEPHGEFKDQQGEMHERVRQGMTVDDSEGTVRM